MRFAPSSEQRDFAASLRDLLGASDVPSVVRSWSAGDYAPGRKLWGRLADAGVTALGLTEENGGYGATAVDLVIGFEELGRFAVPGPLVESVSVLPMLLRDTTEAGRLAEIGAGEAMATLAMPPHVPYAVDADAADVTLLVDGSRLSFAKTGLGVRSVDRSRRLAEVSAGALIASDLDADHALDAGALATAAQILGAGAALLDRATAYAKQRVQFGRPIGQFQAVKHQLADTLVAIELARPLLFGAALSYTDGSPTRARDVSAAKVACTDAAYRAARTALQVHGAIGYTAEYDLSLWLTKVRALASAWGTQSTHRRRVMAAL